jgi:isopropylmalate/homocitrate/citramalate synthase
MPQQATPWHQPGRWFVSPHHWAPEIRDSLPNLPERVHIKDATLQEAADSTGSMISWGDRLQLAAMLADIGVECIKMPHDISLRELADFIRAMDREGIKVEKSFTALVRGDNWRERFKRQVDTGIDTQEIFFMPDGFVPGGPLHKFGEGGMEAEEREGDMSKSEVLELVEESVQFLKEQGVIVVFSFVDTTRSNIEVIKEVYAAGVKAGADRVYVWDTVGCTVPSAAAYLVREVKSVVGDTPICAQFHNDLGFAAGNSFAAVEAGVTWVDSTVNGLGDRGGCVAFEEIVTTLEAYGVDTGVQLDKLYELCKFSEKAWGLPVQAWKPITGETWPLEEAHFTIGQGALKTGELVAPMAINPAAVGREYENVIGTTTLYRGGLEMKLEEWGYEPEDDQIREIMVRLHEAIGCKKFIREPEFKSICVGVMEGVTPDPADNVLTVL